MRSKRRTLRYLLETVTSWAYWQYVLFSRRGAQSAVTALGFIYLVVESLDFFDVYTRSEYGDYAFPALLLLSVVVAVLARRPIRLIALNLRQRDIQVEVVIDDLFRFEGATMISTNTTFESDVAGGKIAPSSLQGQFMAKYYTGNQTELIDQLTGRLDELDGEAPYPMGATVEIGTHGKTFYFTAMAQLNENGNAFSTLQDINQGLEGLWTYVRDAGELQEIAVPVVGTGRGRIQETRKRMIGIIAESFAKASEERKISEKLVIYVRPEDAKKFQVNLYDIKDYLVQILES